MSIGKKPAVGKDVPAFQTSATFTFRQDFSAAGAIRFSMMRTARKAALLNTQSPAMVEEA
jgi:hypothetical protein